ncbi:hypothetical protein SRS16P2_00309 (plasmid) [Variovorax sp. SRS16]|uniref:DUF2889 domain-containing protein n=1 Tax=Variovorax sp. SRS16 TaxID=282217 RepID=UPI0013165274|nr:DUF2889 domain-containing protein [Variovorax sp. SRS16]VTU45754.1 hypothetical protein SRS16P2_00309 [Variovorax sp. SRS16]
MPLSHPQSRQPLNDRTIRCEGFRRDDGLWEVEASLVDTRTYESPTPFRPPVPAGGKFHEMWVRFAMDDARALREVEVRIDSHPFPECPGAVPNFQRLVGLRLGAGFHRELQARVGGEAGCTHVLTLFQTMATVAVQTLSSQIRWNDRAAAERVYGVPPDGGPPPVVGACLGYGRSGEMVRRIYPEHYVAPKAGARDAAGG